MGKTDESTITARVCEESHSNKEAEFLKHKVLKILANWPFGENREIKYYSSCLWWEPHEQGSKVEIYSIKSSSKLTICGKTEKSSFTVCVCEEGCRNEEAKLSKYTGLKIPENWFLGENRQINYYRSWLGREPEEQWIKFFEIYSIKNSSKLTIYGNRDK